MYRVDGPGRVARWLPVGADESAAAMVELLRRLEPTRFPAERLAHPEPISVCAGRPVLVTEVVAGRQAPGTPRMFAVLGGCLGGLYGRPGHGLPAGGGWHHRVPRGSPRDEIAAATALLDTWTGDPAARATLLVELRDLDDGADLPHAIVHPDLVPPNAILRPERGMVIVDWVGCGRGPRLWSLVFLLWVAGNRDPALVDSVISGYHEQVQLTADELVRLPAGVCLGLLLAASLNDVDVGECGGDVGQVQAMSATVVPVLSADGPSDAGKLLELQLEILPVAPERWQQQMLAGAGVASVVSMRAALR